jgi:deoxyribodipyrimidine photo-lyase
MKHVVVWFKRDLRIHDHRPLAEAANGGAITCVYCIEPSLWRSPDVSTQHYQFILESLRDLHQALSGIGLRLNLLVGEATDCLNRLHQALPFDRLLSHEETGNALTYTRDKAVARWCRAQQVQWHQYPQFGVKRGPHDRNGWKSAWQAHCSSPIIPSAELAVPSHLRLIDKPPSPKELGLHDIDPPLRQRGGREEALKTLDAFLLQRSQQYRGGISSPLSAPTACSRVSPYLTYGCLSMREVFQSTQTHIETLSGPHHRQRLGLESFVSRLYWHCHFIQKLEDEPEIEYRNMHRGYDGMREQDWALDRFAALQAGRTGWPLVDACVAMLDQTGWLNFRMRAMLVSVAAYPLWLHWQEVGHWLARRFLDYEPGIHWSQMQMQSGTTGINVPRIYNPIKQARDQDPNGRFVRHWLPAMQRVPDMWLFEPWRMPENLQQSCGVRVGQDIPEPICDLEIATRTAKQALFARRADPSVKAAKSSIVKKHGSRKQLAPKTKRATPRDTKSSGQLSLDF